MTGRRHRALPAAPGITGPGPLVLTRRQKRWPVALLVIVALLVAPGASYTRAMTFPGNASWQVRSVEWVRDHGGNGVVNRVENWWYSRHAPTGAGPVPAALPSWAVISGSGSRGASSPAGADRPNAVAPPAVIALPVVSRSTSNGGWTPGRRGAAGGPAIWTTVVQPDPAHLSVVAAAAWVPRGATLAHLVPGTRQPGGRWPGGASVPASDVSGLVATFNSGWKLKDITGGFYLRGRTAAPLVNGQASAVIDDQGQVTVGRWGRDIVLGKHVVAVRQNLELIVDGGAPVSGLAANGAGRWGSSHNQHQYTWRSGIGNDAHGNLIYVAGGGLTLKTLAAAMAGVGVVRGMELDIHPGMTAFSVWSATQPGSLPSPTRLLPQMSSSARRYLAADQRDFFYLTLR